MGWCGPILRALWLSDHENSSGFEAIRRLAQEFLCAPLPEDLASLLLPDLLHVRDRSPHSTVGIGHDFRAPFFALVGVPAVPADISGSPPEQRHRTAGRHLVAGGGRTVLPHLAVDRSLFIRETLAPTGHCSDLRFASAASCLHTEGRRILCQFLLPAGWLDGRSPAGAGGSLAQLRSFPISEGGLGLAC